MQISGSTLTGGGWTASGTGKLMLPGGNFLTNDGSVTLSGSGLFPQMDSLSENDGSFSLFGGRSFTTIAAFDNSGSLTIGAGSTLTVGTGQILLSSSTVTIDIGGTPASGLFGQLNVADFDTLNGTLNIVLTNGFFPAPGQTFQIMSYGAVNLGFAAINGLTSAGNTIFTAAENPTNFVLNGVQVPAPRITNVLVDGSGWASSYLSALASAGLGNASGYAIPVGSTAQLAPLTWVNLNQIRIVFNENVNAQKSSLLLSGVSVANYAIANFSYDPTTFTATWTLAAPIGKDKLLIDLQSSGPAAVANGQGTAIDGEWTNQVSHYPSGNGAAGGDFLFRFNVLPGDLNQDGIVNGLDISAVASHWLKLGGLMGDANGDGIVNGLDIAAIASHWLNRFSSVPGDANGDGIVNGLDISLVASHWLTHGPAGDVNNDAIVNGLDIALIASHWLQSGAAAAGNGSSATVADAGAEVIDDELLGILATVRR